MRPPLLLHIFPSFNVGGAQVRFAKLANHFGSRWRHAVVALDGQTECLERIAADVDITLIPAPSAKDRNLAQRLADIRRMLVRLEPDLLITSNWGSIEWAIAKLLIPSLPHLHTEDGFGPEESTRQIPRRVLTRQIALRWSTIVLPSQALLKAALSEWRLSGQRVHYIANGLDLGLFNRNGQKETVWPDHSIPHIGTVAALRPEKNLARLLRAAALMRTNGHEFRLTILGDGPERHSLESTCEGLGLTEVVRFAGHRTDPAAYYRGFDIFALSSDTEQMPFSVLEAMASGLPIASTSAGDIRHMVARENAPYIVSGNDSDLAEALASLVSDRRLRLSIGQANRERAVAVYDQGRMLAQYAELIDRTRLTSLRPYHSIWKKGAA